MLGKARDRELSQYGITVTQSGVLHMIKSLGDRANPGNIARVLFREPTTVSNTLIRMEKEGLIKRTKDPKRKSQVCISLTKEGEQAYLESTRRESIKRIMSQMPPDKLQQIRALLLEMRATAMHDLGLSPQNPHLP
jgi:DNA-binding MarR family transcriptional regulator